MHLILGVHTSTPTRQFESPLCATNNDAFGSFVMTRRDTLVSKVT